MFAVSVAQADKGGGGKPVQNRITLNAVGSDPDATGFAEIFFKAKKKGTSQTFHLKIEKVASNMMFTLVVDGNPVDTFASNSGGTYEAIYDSNPKGSHKTLPASLNPVTNIKLVEIKDSTGQVILSGTFNASSGGGKTETKEEIKLVTTGVIPTAQGEAQIEVDKENGVIEDQQLEIDVENLTPSTSFDLFIDNNKIVTFITDSKGNAELKFSSKPENNEQPLPSSLNPLTNIKVVEILRTSDGKVVLTGTFGPPVSKSITLTSTATGSATGKAELTTNGGNPGLEIQVSNMTPLTVFLVKADNILIGALNTDASGAGRLELNTDGKGDCKQPLPSSVTLSNIHTIQITTEMGNVLLMGTF